MADKDSQDLKNTGATPAGSKGTGVSGSSDIGAGSRNADKKGSAGTRNLSGDVMHEGKSYAAGQGVKVPEGFPAQKDIDARLASAAGQQPLDSGKDEDEDKE